MHAKLRKTCRICGRRLTADAMVKDSHATFGFKAICKACYRDERRRYPSYNRRKEVT